MQTPLQKSDNHNHNQPGRVAQLFGASSWYTRVVSEISSQGTCKELMFISLFLSLKSINKKYNNNNQIEVFPVQLNGLFIFVYIYEFISLLDEATQN